MIFFSTMPNCVAPNCSNRSSVKSQRQEEIEKHTNITFHRFPKVEDRRSEWANALGLDLTTLGKNAYICSLHFSEDSFDRTSLACVRLRHHAVPCVYNADISQSVEDYSLPSTSENVLSIGTEYEVFAEKIVQESDKTLLSHPGTSKRCLKYTEDSEVHVPKRRHVTAISNESTIQPTLSDVSTQTPIYLDEAMTPEPTDGRETAIPQNTEETPRKTLLRKALQNQKETSRKLIQALKKQNRRQVKKIAELQSILRDLKSKKLIADEQYDILKTIGMSNTHFLKHFVAKTASRLCKGKKKACAVSRQYSPELRTFAVTLHYYSPRAYNYVRKHFDSENIINMSSRLNRLSNEEIEPQPDMDTLLNTVEDHSYLPDMRSVSLFSSKIISYIAGFVIKNLKKRLHCDECVQALTGSTNHINSELIKIKNCGGLQFPSEDVIKLCRESEKVIRCALIESGGIFLKQKYSAVYLVNSVLSKFTETDVLFSHLAEHQHDQMVLENHVAHLIRAIVSKYIKIRLFHIGKSAIDHSDSDRHRFNKLTLFKGQ